MPKDDPGMESMPDQGKAVVGVKRRLTKDTSGPTMKRPHVNPCHLDLEVAENLAGLVDSTWDEVVKVKEVVSTAEECLWAVEGHLWLIDRQLGLEPALTGLEHEKKGPMGQQVT